MNGTAVHSVVLCSTASMNLVNLPAFPPISNNPLFFSFQGECFGFLGVNGAGKTTSFRMLTGDEYMTKGMASLYGVDIRKEKRRFMRMIGYCPQFDSIIEVLTGREMLNLFAHIRGIPGSKRKEEVSANTRTTYIFRLLDKENVKDSPADIVRPELQQKLLRPQVNFAMDILAVQKLLDQVFFVKDGVEITLQRRLMHTDPE